MAQKNIVVTSYKSFTSEYFLLPHKRAQDVVRIEVDFLGADYVISILDGWHNSKMIDGNVEGKKAAEYVAKLFPRLFLSSDEVDFKKRAQIVADDVDKQLLNIYPQHVSCVGDFIFCREKKIIIVTIGTINTWIFKGGKWIKPRGVYKRELDWRTNESGSETFFGRGELKPSPLYSNKVDVVVLDQQIPLLCATDGLNEILTIRQLNKLNSKKLLDSSYLPQLLKEIKKRIPNQRDDISVLLLKPKA